MNWLCWHVGTVTDPKLRRIADECRTPLANVIALWAMILESAKDRRGQFSVDTGDAAYLLGAAETDVGAVLRAFDARGLTSGGAVAKWKERQHGTSAARMERSRAAKGGTAGEVTESDAQGVTVQSVTPTLHDSTVHDITDTLTANAVKGGDAAASAPVNLKSQVFGPCLTWLAQATARTPKALRPHVGRWCKDYGDALVIECILDAQREAPVDPEGWIIGALRRRKGKHGNGTAKHRDASSADAKSERRTDIVEGLGLDVSGHGGAGVGGTEGDATGRDSGLPLAPSPGGDRGFGRAA